MSLNRVFLMITGIGIALILGFLAGTHRGEGQPSAPVVRSYQVPIGRANEIRNALNNLFWKGKVEDNLGHAQLFNGGILLVRAPEEIQAGVQSLLDRLSAQKLPATNTIHIDYWLVTGEEATTSNEAKFRDLSPVLSSIVKAEGPRVFRVLEHLASNTLNGQKVQLKGSIVDSKLTANLIDGHINLDTEVHSAFGEVDSSSRIDSGEYIVLGENSIKPTDVHLRDDEKLKGGHEEKQVGVYHILHAELK